MLREYAISSGIPYEKMFVTKDVENTGDEAVAVKELISPSKRIILLTPDYHMNRAKRLFEKQEFIVIFYKVDYKSDRDQAITILDFLPKADNLKKLKLE